MKCACKELVSVIPPWLRTQVESLVQCDLQEIRLRFGQKPMLVCKNGTSVGRQTVTQEDISYVVNTASRYSPWAANTVSHGYVTAPGGHRIGICGEAVMQNGVMTGVRKVRSLCIRVARDFPGIADQLYLCDGSTVILGPPGSGKTTLLRDFIRQRSIKSSVAVVDERCEIFPMECGYEIGANTDILCGCDKETGVDNVLRAMGPSVIAVDEITSANDAKALYHAGNCGVQLLATAHAGSLKEYYNRPLYRSLIENRVFDFAVVLKRDQTYYLEKLR